MQRTVISLSKQDHIWLDHQAKLQHKPKTELIRQAVKLYRQRAESKKKTDFASLLEQTQGILKIKDGLKYQETLRAEWDDEQ